MQLPVQLDGDESYVNVPLNSVLGSVARVKGTLATAYQSGCIEVGPSCHAVWERLRREAVLSPSIFRLYG